MTIKNIGRLAKFCMLAVLLCTIAGSGVFAQQNGNCGTDKNPCVGAAASTGPQGPQGATGDTGPKGDAGAVGAVGPQGIQGLVGPKGDSGLQGIQGLVGPKGDTGAVGAVGPQGIEGLVGPKGDSGLQGIQGLAGSKGDPGAVGAVGPQGVQGFVGPRGDTGLQGIQGVVGAAGKDGLNGAPGKDGVNGQGPKGDRGDRGENGTPGSFLIVTPFLTNMTKPVPIPGATLADLVQVAQFSLSAGDFVLTGTVDLAPTLPIGQQFTCQLKDYRNEVIDSSPIVIAGGQVRLVMQGIAHMYFTAPLMLNCGSDSPARLVRAQFSATQVDRLNPVGAVTTPGN